MIHRDTKYRLLIISSIVSSGLLNACSPIYSSTRTQPLTAKLAQAIFPVALMTQLNLDELGQALRGYDPVAYFQEQKPVLGKAEFQIVWQGAYWRFASAKNRDTFLANPQRYQPAYGGFCTFGVALGEKLDSDPRIWLIENGQLYLFLNRDTQTAFLQNKADNLFKASQNWQKLQYLTPHG